MYASLVSFILWFRVSLMKMRTGMAGHILKCVMPFKL